MTLRPLTAAVLAIVLASPAAASASEARLGYTVTYLGFTIAKANLALKVDGGLYTLGLGFRTTGVVKVVSDAKGAVEAKGTVAGGKAVGALYTLKSEEREEAKDVRVESDNGAVRAVAAVPPLKNLETRVPILAEHKRQTTDPLSGALFPIVAAEPLAPENCARTAPVYDGWTRYDIVFSFKKKVPVKLKGYSGDGLVCAARFVPVAGHRPDARGTKFMADNKNLEVTLVPTATGFLVPSQIVIATLTGTIVITADRFAAAAD
jgi:hypothetical protein